MGAVERAPTQLQQCWADTRLSLFLLLADQALVQASSTSQERGRGQGAPQAHAACRYSDQADKKLAEHLRDKAQGRGAAWLEQGWGSTFHLWKYGRVPGASHHSGLSHRWTDPALLYIPRCLRGRAHDSQETTFRWKEILVSNNLV